MERWLGSEVLVHMPEVRYGGENGETTHLEVDPDLVVVRARRGDSLREGPVPGPEAALLKEMEPVLSFPEVGVEVYRRRERASRSMEEMRRELHESPATRFAGRVLVDEHSREPTVYTENLFVKFYDGTNRDQCLAVLREAGLIVKRELPYATNAYFVAAPEGTGQRIFDIANELLEREDVEYCGLWVHALFSRSSGISRRPRSMTSGSMQARTSRPLTPLPKAKVSRSPSSTRG